MTSSKSATTGLDVGARILADTPVSRWRWFDEFLGASDPKWFPEFGQLSSDLVDRLIEQAADPGHTVALLAMNPSDAVRQAAVGAASRAEPPTLLALALVRATDRVETIRSKAQAVVDELRAGGGDNRFVPCLRLLRTAPVAGDGYLKRLRTVVVAGVGRSALIGAVERADVNARREAARVLVERGEADQAFVSARVQNDSVSAVIVVRGLSPAFGAVHANLDAAIGELRSADFRRVIDALPIVGARLGEPRADAALFDKMTRSGDQAPIGRAAEMVLGEGSLAGRRLFARAWNFVGTNENWQIGDILAGSLASARWDLAPDSGALEDWTDLMGDAEPGVAAGSADINAWLANNDDTT